MSKPSSGPRLLLVEDEAIIALAQAKKLENAGFQVTTVHSGEAAVETALSDPEISLVLMDIDLGRGMDGTEAASRIMDQRALPVVFLTSHSEKEMVDRVKGITRYGYVLKNSGPFVLVESVNMALELFQAHEATRERERRIRRLNRTYQVLSDVNQTIVRVEDEAELFSRICEIAVDRGDFMAAWIDRPLEDASGLEPVVLQGDERLRQQIEPAEASSTDGPASAGLKALAEGTTQIINNCDGRPAEAARPDPEHAEAARADPEPASSVRDPAPRVGSLAAVPVAVFGEPRYILTLCAPLADFFDEDERRLVEELVMDLGFALEVQEKERHRRQVEAERREWQELLDYIIHHDPNAITVLDTKLHHLYASDRFCEDYRVRKDDVIGRHHYEVFPEIPEKWREVHARALAGEVLRSEDDQFIRLDGSVDYTRWECRPWYHAGGEIGGIVLYTEVITSLKIAEQRRRTVFGALESLLAASPDLVSMIDADGRYWMVSDSTAQALGRPKSEIIGRGFDELLPPAVAAEFRWSIAAVVDSGEQHIKTDTMPGPDGDPRSYQTTLFPARIVDGTVTMVGVLSVDITERVRSEQRARENEQRWQYAVDNAGDGLWDWDARTDRVFYSSRWKSMLGYAESEIGDGLDEWESRIHPDDYTDTFQKLQRHLRGESAEYRHEHRLRCKDGGYKWILDRGKVVERDEDGKPLRVIGTHTDIDRRKRLEEELRRGRTT